MLVLIYCLKASEKSCLVRAASYTSFSDFVYSSSTQNFRALGVNFNLWLLTDFFFSFSVFGRLKHFSKFDF